MNPELEKLIDMVVADGQITEKERAVVIKKAIELGIDPDEAEVHLDGKLHQINQVNKQVVFPAPPLEKKSNKEGDIKKCPGCGAPVTSFNTKCSDCGHEFRNTEANSGVKQLEEKLSKIPVDDLYYETKVANLIKTHPIPNTKEDLFEMLSYMSGKVLSSSDVQISGNEITHAYHSRALEVINKLMFMADVDPIILKRVEDIKNEMTKHKGKSNIKAIITAVVILGLLYGMYLIGKSFFK